MAAHQYSRDVMRFEQRDLPVLLNFDTWTPRPHFAIVQKQSNQNASPQDLDGAFQLAYRFLSSQPEYDQNKAIMSFHGGKWYQESTSQWHVHLVVPWDPYIKEAEQWVTFTLKNKQWCKATRYTDAMKTRKWREVEKYNEYKLHFLSDVNQGKVRSNAIDLSQFENAKFGLIWTSASIDYPFPFIGVTLRPGTQQRPLQREIHGFLEDLRRSLASINRYFDNFGCHMCVFVSAASQGCATDRDCNAIGPDGTAYPTRIVGYLLVEDSCYYAWLPENLKRAWLQSFEHCPHFVDT